MTMTTALDADTSGIDEDDAEFYDPRGTIQHREFASAPRLRTLAGVSVALLSNRKRNADRLLEQMAAILVEEHGIGATIVDAKEAMSLPAPEEQLRKLAGMSEALIVAVGDCGSCSATSVMDAVAAERMGLPAVPIVTEAFRSGAELVASIQGADAFPIAYVEHPIATLEDRELSDRAREAVGEVIAILISPRP